MATDPAEPLQMCATCDYFCPPPVVPLPALVVAGTCHADPPVTHYTWPKTYPTGWCGRWTSKEQAAERAARKERGQRPPREAKGTKPGTDGAINFAAIVQPKESHE